MPAQAVGPHALRGRTGRGGCRADADDARRRLEDERLAVLDDRIDADLAAGGGAQLVPELERLVAQHPLRERMHAQLMRALYASGRQADALEAYRRARRILSDELGLEPGPELQYRVRCGPRLVTVS
ncbi:MAG TPA: AfsR/SARP family transcriptional regulator [Gaiellaceae bacterium]